jgi:hypothetical protein
MTDDFLARISGKIDAQKDAVSKMSAVSEENRVFGLKAIASALIQANEMREKLRPLGITLRVRGDGSYLKCELHWADGGHHNLELTSEQERNYHLQFYTDYTKSDRRSSRGTHPSNYNKLSWREDTFIKYLEKNVDDYVGEASLHEGVN